MDKKLIMSILVLQIITLIFLGYGFIVSEGRYKLHKQSMKIWEEANKNYTRQTQQYEEAMKEYHQQQEEYKESLNAYKQQQEEYNKQMDEYKKQVTPR